MRAIYTSAAFTNASGLAVAAGAAVEVRRERDGALAAVFSDEAGTVGLANPFAADSSGRFAFYAAGIERGYQVKVTAGADVNTLHNQAVGTAAQFDASTFGGSLMGAADAATARALIWNAPMLERFQRRGRLMAALNFNI